MVRYLFYTIGDLTYQSPLVREEECKGPWLFFETERGEGAKTFWKQCARGFAT